MSCCVTDHRSSTYPRHCVCGEVGMWWEGMTSDYSTPSRRAERQTRRVRPFKMTEAWRRHHPFRVQASGVSLHLCIARSTSTSTECAHHDFHTTRRQTADLPMSQCTRSFSQRLAPSSQRCRCHPSSSSRTATAGARTEARTRHSFHAPRKCS